MISSMTCSWLRFSVQEQSRSFGSWNGFSAAAICSRSTWSSCSSVGSCPSASPKTSAACFAWASGSRLPSRLVVRVGEVLAARPAGSTCWRCSSVSCRSSRASGPPASRRRRRRRAGGDEIQDLVERHGRLAVERLRRRLVLLAHAHGIDDDEVGLVPGVGRDALQGVGIDHPARRGPSSARSRRASLMFRMKSRHSSGFTSVPVAIMSTVTAMRGL